ncbi:hypothetical protein AALA98_14115 [Lachnospiraceae bacterium 45-W7]
MDDRQFKKLVKIAVEKLKDESVLELLRNDVSYQKDSKNEGEAEDAFHQLDLTKKQREVRQNLLDCRDKQDFEYGTHAYIVGLVDAFHIMAVLFPEKWDIDRVKFHVNESKDIVTEASKIHGISAAIGFIAFLFFPLLNGILAFKQGKISFGVVCVISFILALIFFICFIMGDKEQFQNTMLRYEGMWERLTLFCMYIPLVYKAVHNLVS